MFYIFLQDRNGDTIAEYKYDTAEELIKEYPYAEYQGDGCYTSWIGGGV